MNELQPVPSSLLEISELSKRYGSKLVLSGLSLNIGRGGMIGLLGPNGCGKTTLLKLICGLLTPSDGEIRIFGEKPSHKSLARIAYLPDRSFLTPSDRIRDAVEYFADFYRDFDSEKAFDLIEMLGLDPKTRIRTLSKGNRDKIQLILVMSRRAELYLLDEPLGGVDPAARDYILDTIMKNFTSNNDRGSSVIISTHMIAEIEQVLDDVIFLADGKVALCASVESIHTQHGITVDELFREVYKC